MIILSFVVATDCLNHLKFMKLASPLFKLKIIIQVLISVNICFMNALMAAAQPTGFDMLANSLAMLFLNDLDNIIANLYHAFSSISLDLEEVAVHTR